jgi:hypothetical protein
VSEPKRHQTRTIIKAIANASSAAKASAARR